MRKLATALSALVVVLAGCTDTNNMVQRAEEEIARSQKKNEESILRIKDLERELEVVYNALQTKELAFVKQSRDQTELFNQRVDELQTLHASQLATVQKREAELRDKLVAAEKLAKEQISVVDTKSTSVPLSPVVRVWTPDEINTKVEYEQQIKNLTARISIENAKVTNLIHASVDAHMIPPPGGYVSGNSIYRRVLTCGHGTILRSPGYTHTHSSSCYTSRLVGPAVIPGAFRTEHDRDQAITTAKAAILPLHEELRKVRQQLADLVK